MAHHGDYFKGNEQDCNFQFFEVTEFTDQFTGRS